MYIFVSKFIYIYINIYTYIYLYIYIYCCNEFYSGVIVALCTQCLCALVFWFVCLS